MKKTLMWARTGVVGAAVLGAACSGSSGHDDAGGSTEVLAVTASALSADVTGVNLSISGAGIAPTITTTLVKAGNKFQGIVTGIPAGSGRTFHGDGVDAAGAIAYAGDASGVTIAKGAKAFVALVLQQKRAPDPFHNSAPQIDAVSASSDTVEPGGSVTVTARASDPDGDPLTFSWTSTGGTFAAGSASTTTWTAGAEGTPTLTLRVRDTKGASAAISFVVNVHATTGTGIASISASFNDAPTVQSMTIDQTPLDVGQTAHLGLTATDIDGDAIASYAWTSTCTGTFADATAAAPAFTLSALPAAGRSCAFSVKITDARGGWNTGALSIQTGAPIDVSRPPVVDTTFQAADVADGGQSLTFRVKGHDPDGTAVAYSWTSPVGTFAPATTTANGESEVVWTAPACFYGTAVVSATLTDATGASTTQAFNVTAGASNCPTRPIQIASVSTAGVQADNDTNVPAISADGRYVAFMSVASNLGGGTGHYQIYVRDVVAGTTTVASTAIINGSNFFPSISGDGRYVAFASNTALVGGGYSYDVTVRDMQTGILSKVTTVASSQGSLGIDVPRISLDGHHLCFMTNAALEPSDTNGNWDVYVSDLANGSLRRLSAGSAPGYSGYCAISADGARVSFVSTVAFDAADTNNALDVYVGDMLTDPPSLTLVTDGVQAGVDGFNAISADGNSVAFSSPAALLGEGGGIVGSSIYVRRLTTGALLAGSNRVDQHNAYWPSLSRDGSVVAFYENQGSGFQVYTRSLSSGLLTLQSVSAAGVVANREAYAVALSADGLYIAFASSATNLVDSDINGQPDIFVAPRR